MKFSYNAVFKKQYPHHQQLLLQRAIISSNFAYPKVYFSNKVNILKKVLLEITKKKATRTLTLILCGVIFRKPRIVGYLDQFITKPFAD